MEVHDLRDEFLICRAIGHRWDDNPTAEIDSELFRAATSAAFLRCDRCGTERFDYYGHAMELFARYYRYPHGYEGLSRPEEQTMGPLLRAELFSRSVLLRRHGKTRLRRVS